METESRELNRPRPAHRADNASREIKCQEAVPEEEFVPARENELAPHAPTGLSNPFWSE